MTHTVTSIAGDNGIIDPSGESQIEDNGKVTFQAVPMQDYKVCDWRRDDQSVTSEGEFFTLANITADSKIEVDFDEEKK